MKPMIPNIQDAEFFNILKEAIKNHTPYSMVRLGDGEARILKGTIRRDSIRKKWFDDSIPDQDMVKTFQDLLVHVVGEADAVGIIHYPAVKQELSNFCKDLSEEQLSKFIRYLGKPENYQVPISTLPVSNKMIFDASMFRRSGFGNVSKYIELFQNEPLHIVSCRTAGLIKNRIGEVLRCDVTFTDIPSTARYADVLKMVDFKNIKEHVIVFGTGVGGKQISTEAKKHGKVGFDIGSVIDGWAGCKTRVGAKIPKFRDHLIIQNGTPLIKD